MLFNNDVSTARLKNFGRKGKLIVGRQRFGKGYNWFGLSNKVKKKELSTNMRTAFSPVKI